MFALCKDNGLSAFELVFGRHIADSALQALLIVGHYKPFDQLAGSSAFSAAARDGLTLPLLRERRILNDPWNRFVGYFQAILVEEGPIPR